MQSIILSAALFTATVVQGVSITSPTKDEVVDLDAGVTVTWTTVSSDPKSAHLFLVNQAGGHTPYSKDLGAFDLSAGGATVSLADVSDDTGYQFNLQSVEENNTGILAQSQQFEVDNSSSDDGGDDDSRTSTAASTSAPATTAAAVASSSSLSSASSSSSSNVVIVTPTTAAVAASSSSAAASGLTTVATSAVVAATASATKAANGTASATGSSSPVTVNSAGKVVGGGLMALVFGAAALLL